MTKAGFPIRLGMTFFKYHMLSLVLSRRDFKENDQVITLYTLSKGKVEILARGVKKILSKNSAHLEPFCLIEADVIPGKGLTYLGGTSPIKNFKNIRQDFLKSASAGYLTKFLDKVLVLNEPDKNIFNLIISWLDFVDLTPKFDIFLLDVFMIKFLKYSGWDLSALDNLKPQVKADLELALKSDWQVKLSISSQKVLHNLVWDFIKNNLEIKLLDWQNIPKTC